MTVVDLAAARAAREPDLGLMLSLARYHDADPRVVLAVFGWRPPPGHVPSETELLATRVAAQIAHAIGIKVECGDEAAADLA